MKEKDSKSFGSWYSKARWYFDRTFSEKSTSQLIWLVAIIAIVFCLIWTFSYPFSEKTFEDSTPSMSRTVRIISLLINPGAVSEVSPTLRIFAILVAVIGIVILRGFLITVLSNMLERHVEHYRNGDIHYKLSKHIIVIGFNNYTISLLKKLFENNTNNNKILLVTCVRSSIIRERLEAEFSSKARKRIIYYSEDFRSRNSLEMLDSDKAKEIYILGDKHHNNDSDNLCCLNYLLQINTNRQAPIIPCYLFLDSSASNFIIKQQGIRKEWSNSMRIIPINVAENWAKKLLVFGKQYGYPRISLLDSKGHNYLIIIGMTNWGVALAEVFARVSHIFPKEFQSTAYSPSSEIKNVGETTITFIDNDIDEKMEKFCAIYAPLFEIQGCEYIITQATSTSSPMKSITASSKFLDVNFTFIKGNVYNHWVRDFIYGSSNHNSFIAICNENDNENVEVAIHLPDCVYKKNIPVFVRQNYSNIIDDLVKGSVEFDEKLHSPKYKYTSVYPFGMLNDYDYLLNSEIDDKYVRFITDIYNDSNHPNAVDEVMVAPVNKYIENLYHGYYIHLLWEELTEKSNQEISDFLQNNKDILMEIEHLRWCVNKLMSGYSTGTIYKQTYYVNKYIVPYKKLDAEFKEFCTCTIQYLKIMLEKKYDHVRGMT